MPASLIRVATSHACLLSMSFFKCSLTQNPTQIRKVKLFQLKRRLGPLEPVQRPPKSLAITATEPEDYGKHSVKAETTTSSWLCISFFLIPYSDGWQILETFPLSPVKNQRKTHIDAHIHKPHPTPTQCTIVYPKNSGPGSSTWSSGSHWGGLPLGQEISQLCLFHGGQFSCKKFVNP